MDLSYSSFLTFLITLFLSSLFLVLKQRAKPKLLVNAISSRPIPPPGPPKLPIIGSMHHLRGALTHHALRNLSMKYGPIMQLKLGEVDMVVISSPDASREVTRTHDLHLCSRPANMVSDIGLYGNIDIAFSPYGDYWRQLRKICVTELLSVSRVRSFRSVREEETLNLARAVSSTPTPTSAATWVVNLTKMLSSMTNAITCRIAFGKACENSERFIMASEELIRLSSCFNLAGLFPSLSFLKALSLTKYKIERAHKRLDMLLDRIIREHIEKRAASTISAGKDHEEEEEENKEDLVDVLLRVKDSSNLEEVPITMNGIKAMLLDVFAAGTDTKKLIIEWAMSELMRNPQVMEKAQSKLRRAMDGKTAIEEADIQDLDYLKLIINETLRLHPPVPLLLPRLCRETCNVGGFTITKGSTVLINVWAMGRDPKIWDDAESFRPERFEGSSVNFKGTCYEYIPFGAGRRMCPGIGYGLATVELTLARLLYHFNWLLPNGMKPEELDMTETFGTTVNRKNDLLLIARPHIPIA